MGSLLIFAILFQVQCVYSQTSSPTITADELFKYESIPFGQTVDQVKGTFGSTRFLEGKPSIEEVCNYELEGSFKNGIYTSGFGFGCFLMPDIVKCYTLRGEDGDIKLYFVCDAESDSAYKLMMVIKKLPSASGELESTFNSLKGAIALKLPVSPQVLNKRYGSETQRRQYNETFPAMVAIWTTEETKVILMSEGYLNTCYRHVLYRSESLWKKYLRLSQAVSDAKKRNSEEKSGAAGSKF